ncbi:thioredoxin family protein [Streptomyces omiyaensis]|uniref:Thioredoxin family protein n=1 Tax=Streptomyces omiyaensis TaxID=68247 RepID=A0ABW7BSJ1_9ACTN
MTTNPAPARNPAPRDPAPTVPAPAGNPAPVAAATVKVTSDADFAADALSPGPPVLVQFTAAWCGPCRRLKPVLAALAAEEEGRLRVVEIDVDHNPATTVRHGVLATPTLLVLKDGEPVKSLVGARSKRKLRQELADVLD